MARYIYLCKFNFGSEDSVRQQKCVNDYLSSIGKNSNLSEDITKTVVEQISITTKTRSKLNDLLEQCSKGDIIYVGDLSQLGNNMKDIFHIVSSAINCGVTIIQCKDGVQIENETVGGKAFVNALSLAAKVEFDIRRQNTQAALDTRKKLLQKNGFFVSKSGRVVTKFGREKGCDLTIAREASTKSKQEKAALFRMNNKGYQSVVHWLEQGQTTEWILAEFNKYHKSDPKNYCTITGKPLTESTLKQWRTEIKRGKYQKVDTNIEKFSTIEEKTDSENYSIISALMSKQQDFTSVDINKEKLYTLERQTEENRELLSSIFDKEDDVIQDIIAENQGNIWMDMLKLLFMKEVWERIELEAECKKRGLMLGAVLEQINDFAYSKIDDAVVEDDEKYIYVTLEYKDQLI